MKTVQTTDSLCCARPMILRCYIVQAAKKKAGWFLLSKLYTIGKTLEETRWAFPTKLEAQQPQVCFWEAFRASAFSGSSQCKLPRNLLPFIYIHAAAQGWNPYAGYPVAIFPRDMTSIWSQMYLPHTSYSFIYFFNGCKTIRDGLKGLSRGTLQWAETQV